MSDASIGYIAVVVAVVCFGSNFVPIKNIKIGDGVFFQFCMCCAVFMTSIPVLLIQGFPPVHGMAILGGFLWCTGNMLCPLAIRFIGMGMSLILWGSTNMLMGWASGKFGLFGLKKQAIGDPVLNYAGVALAILGLIVYVQVKTVDTSEDAKDLENDVEAATTKEPLLPPSQNGQKPRSQSVDVVSTHSQDALMQVNTIQNSRVTQPMTTTTAAKRPKTVTFNSLRSASFGDNWSEETKRLFGILAALMAGALFGLSFDPAQYVIDNKYNGNDDTLNYVFSQYLGILITSWAYTVLYCYYCLRNDRKPYIHANIVLPATVSGIIWGIAETAWFVANGRLGFPISFPIICAGPGFVGAAWGVFIFKEITGTENLRTLAVAMGVTIPALILVGVSH